MSWLSCSWFRLLLNLQSKHTRLKTNELMNPRTLGSSCSFKSVTPLISMTSGATNNDLVHYTMFCQRTRGHIFIFVTCHLLSPTTMKLKSWYQAVSRLNLSKHIILALLIAFSSEPPRLLRQAHHELVRPGCVSIASRGVSSLLTVVDCSAQQSQLCILRSLRSLKVNVALTANFSWADCCSPALLLCLSLSLCSVVSSSHGPYPWYPPLVLSVQWNQNSPQSVGCNGVFGCPRSPSWLKGNDRTAVEVQGGVALLAVLFASVAMAMGFYHLVVSPSISTRGGAHFATKDVPECCWSWAQGAWKSFIQPLLEACGGGETYSPCLYFPQVLPADLPFFPQNQHNKNLMKTRKCSEILF